MLENLGKIIKQQRLMIPMTLGELSAVSGVSSSHLGRIKRGERFPSAHILRKIAKPLGFDEAELLTYAGFLSTQTSTTENRAPSVSRLPVLIVVAGSTREFRVGYTAEELAHFGTLNGRVSALREIPLGDKATRRNGQGGEP